MSADVISCSAALAASALAWVAAALVSARRKARSVGLLETKTRGNVWCCRLLIPLPYLSLEWSRQCMAATAAQPADDSRFKPLGVFLRCDQVMYR